MRRTAATVSSAMTRSIVSVSPETKVSEALARTKEAEHLMVAEDGNVIGIVCSCDLERARPDHEIARHMKSPVFMVAGSASLDEAADLLREKGVGSLPVLAGSLMVGIVTRSDLIRAGVPVERVGGRCASCGEQHHLGPGDGARFCADCLECARVPADLGEVD